MNINSPLMQVFTALGIATFTAAATFLAFIIVKALMLYTGVI